MSLTNHYFNNYNAKNEQHLLEDLIVESIKIMGFAAYYIPIFNTEDRDILYGEDPLKKFKTAYPIEMYLSTVLQYEGDRDFFSKFGLEIRNEVSVILSKRSFTERIPNTITRPREGDLIYVPVINGVGNLMEITFTDHTKDFFALGRKLPYFYELKLEQYRYSQEIIDTGVAEIDSIVQDVAYTINFELGVGFGNFAVTEIIYQSPDGTYANSTCQASVQEWDAPTKTLGITYMKGEFIEGDEIYGLDNNASYILTTYNPIESIVKNDTYDNNYINLQGDNVSVFTESNPFGSI